MAGEGGCPVRSGGVAVTIGGRAHVHLTESSLNRETCRAASRRDSLSAIQPAARSRRQRSGVSVAVPAVAWTLEWAGRPGSRRIEPPADADHEQPRLAQRDAARGEHEAIGDAGAVPVEVDSAVDGRIDRRPTDDPAPVGAGEVPGPGTGPGHGGRATARSHVYTTYRRTYRKTPVRNATTQQAT